MQRWQLHDREKLDHEAVGERSNRKPMEVSMPAISSLAIPAAASGGLDCFRTTSTVEAIIETGGRSA